MDKICIKATVSGVVQGVGFRYHTAHEGLKLSLKGYARNQADGTVEVLMCGEKEQVQKLLMWLEKGPATACVNSVEHQELPWKHYDDFKIQ